MNKDDGDDKVMKFMADLQRNDICPNFETWYQHVQNPIRQRMRRVITKYNASHIDLKMVMIKIENIVYRSLQKGLFEPCNTIMGFNVRELKPWMLCVDTVIYGGTWNGNISAFQVAMDVKTPISSLLFLLDNGFVELENLAEWLQKNTGKYDSRMFEKLVACYLHTRYVVENGKIKMELSRYTCTSAELCNSKNRACNFVQAVADGTEETGVFDIKFRPIRCAICRKSLRGKRRFRTNAGIGVFLVGFRELVTYWPLTDLAQYAELIDSALESMNNIKIHMDLIAWIVVNCPPCDPIDNVLQKHHLCEKCPELAERVFKISYSGMPIKRLKAMHFSIHFGSHPFGWYLNRSHDKKEHNVFRHLAVVLHSDGILKCNTFCDYKLAAATGMYTFFTELSDEELMTKITRSYCSFTDCARMPCTCTFAAYNDIEDDVSVTKVSPLEILLECVGFKEALAPCFENLWSRHRNAILKSIDILEKYVRFGREYDLGKYCSTLRIRFINDLHAKAKRKLKKGCMTRYLNSSKSPLSVLDVHIIRDILNCAFDIQNAI